MASDPTFLFVGSVLLFFEFVFRNMDFWDCRQFVNCFCHLLSRICFTGWINMYFLLVTFLKLLISKKNIYKCVTIDYIRRENHIIMLKMCHWRNSLLHVVNCLSLNLKLEIKIRPNRISNCESYVEVLQWIMLVLQSKASTS